MKKALGFVGLLVVLSTCSGCASMLAGNFRNEVRQCQETFASGTDERAECVAVARDIYAQKSHNLRVRAILLSR